MSHISIGGVECISMARGYDITDAMLKTSKVKLLLSRTVCPGKYMVLITGDVADVTASVDAGAQRAQESFVDKFVIPNIHPDVLPAIQGTAPVTALEALGVLETFSVASVIEAADTCIKTADIKLLEIRLAMAMGGKGLVRFTGSIAACNAALEAGAANVGQKGLLVQKILISQPRPELLTDLI